MQRDLELSFDSGRPDAPTDLSGVTLEGPAGVVRCDRDTIARLDLRPNMLCGGCDSGAADGRAILAIRAYLAEHPGAFWQDPLPLFGAPCDRVVTSEAFAHVVGRRYEDEDVPPEVRAIGVAPSESPTFRSLAEALVSGDPSRFVPGASNLDWRIWATLQDPTWLDRAGTS
ncbi:MAG: hypothetical protein U0270_02395 [Labilithrix sp.]